MCTRVQSSTVDNWKKLARVVAYLQGEPKLGITLTFEDSVQLQWWVDGAFAIYPDMRSYTGAHM